MSNKSDLLGKKAIVKVESLEPLGRGVCRHEGFVLFVPFVIPGELVEVEITLQKKDFGEARLLKILEPSADRRPAPCSVFTRCGGCQWQHLDAARQLQEKLNFFTTNFSAKFEPSVWVGSTPNISLRKSPKSYSYRNRVQPVRTESGWAYRAHHSHELIDVVDCHIADEAIRKRWSSLWEESSKLGKHEIILNDSGEAQLRTEFADNFEGVFAQVNAEQNQQIQSDLLSVLETDGVSRVFDFYCGSGNFTFQLAENFKGKIIGVDGSPILIKKAQQEALRRKFHARVNFYASGIKNFVTSVGIDEGSLVVVDPPRGGLEPEVSEVLAISQPMRLIYISCNFMTFLRDLKIICRPQPGGRFKVSQIFIYEMFPQTPHFEVMASIVWEH